MIVAPFFVWAMNTPIVSLARFNNSIVIGSLVVWIAALLPAYALFRVGVTRYRERIHARLEQTRFFQALKASKLWTLYQWFAP